MYYKTGFGRKTGVFKNKTAYKHIWDGTLLLF